MKETESDRCGVKCKLQTANREAGTHVWVCRQDPRDDDCRLAQLGLQEFGFQDENKGGSPGSGRGMHLYDDDGAAVAAGAACTNSARLQGCAARACVVRVPGEFLLDGA